MKILLFAYTDDPGNGWGRYTADLSEALQAQGHTVKILQGANPRWYFLNPFFLLYLLPGLVRARRALRAYAPDIVHITAEPYALMLPFLPQAKHAVLTIHGTYAYLPSAAPGYLRPLYRYLFARALARIHSIIAVSDYTREYFLREAAGDGVAFQAQRVHTVHNGIRVSDYPFVASPARLPDGKNIILTVGAVKSRKGILESLRALGEYKKHSGANFEYRVVGTNTPTVSYARLLKEEIHTQGLEGMVTFVGRVSQAQKQKEYSQADLFLMLTRAEVGHRFEGFGLVYLEANACGVPVIASSGSGPAEAVQDGVSGFVVNSGDSGAVAGRIAQILEHHAIDRTAARRWAQMHDMQSVANKVISLYQSALVS